MAQGHLFCSAMHQMERKAEEVLQSRQKVSPFHSGVTMVAPLAETPSLSVSTHTTHLTGFTMSDSSGASKEVKIQRFIRVLNQAQVANHFTQRQLCAQLGITIGTMTKYLRGAVNPDRVATEIQAALAKQVGVTLDSLINYYETGEYKSALTMDEIVSFINSEVGQAEMPKLLAAMTNAAGKMTAPVFAEEKSPAKYTWPAEALSSKGVSETMLKRLGLNQETLELLADGIYDDEVVEGFAMAMQLPEEAVVKAFEAREPVAA
jgi:transcriptional regulator with XRE-family HTH domain